jgi:beta-fructofuranosidase
MWECPDLFSLEDKDVLITCPQGMESKGILYNNRYQAGYFAGSLNYESGAMNHGGFTELDRGFEFYAPQTCKDNLDRRVIYGWMGMPEEEEQPTKEHHWLHMLTLPRVLELKDDKIYQRVPEELKKLRKNSVLATNVKIKDDEKSLEGFYGDVYELCIELEVEDAEEVGLKIRCSKDGEEYTMLSFFTKQKLITVDRNKSGKALSGERSCKLKDNKRLKLQIFSDRSSLEVFINDGEEVFSLRTFPNIESKYIRFFSKGGTVKFNNITYWEY